MVLISTWLEWSGMAFRNADAKRGMQQRFHQQKDSIREDLRWVLLFKDFGWVCLVTTQFQFAVLWSCQRIKHDGIVFSPYQQKMSYYGDVPTTGWSSAIPWRYSLVPVVTDAYLFHTIVNCSTNPFYASPEACGGIIRERIFADVLFRNTVEATYT